MTDWNVGARMGIGVSPIMTGKYMVSIYGGLRYSRLKHYTDKPEAFRFYRWHHFNAPYRLHVNRISVPVGAQITVRVTNRVYAKLYAEYQFPLDYQKIKSRNVVTKPNIPSPIGVFNTGIGLDYNWSPIR